MTESNPTRNADLSLRKDWMGLLARAVPDHLAALMGSLAVPDHSLLRGPEIGTVMVQGRAGATGTPFNLGEVTVTRCTVQFASGEIGHGHVLGRDRTHAMRAALVDALMQTAQAEAIRADVLAPIANAAAERREARAEKAAATKVEFFTLVRGEDE